MHCSVFNGDLGITDRSCTLLSVISGRYCISKYNFTYFETSGRMLRQMWRANCAVQMKLVCLNVK